MWFRKLDELLNRLAYWIYREAALATQYIMLLKRRYSPTLAPVATLVVLLGVLNLGTLMLADKTYRHFSASETKPLKADATLDEAAVYFKAKTQDIINANECFPMHMNQPSGINILYLYCSDTAYAHDGKEVKVTEHFGVSSRLARRFNFWRRIYSLWGEDQYVLHLAEFPEVVLEIADASPLGEEASWQTKKSRARKVLDVHRWKYKEMLWQMHKHRHQPERFSPAMRRIAATMRHISNPNKYMLAARNVRIQRGQRDQIAAGLATAPRYMKAVGDAFVEEGLPRELSQLAFIESSFNLKAYSKVGAAGVYQIMPSTGKQYMIVSDAIDERRDPIKSAHAAAKLLKMNKKILGEWPLAVTAYNHGAGGIRRAVRTVGSNQIDDLIEKYDGPAFGFASKNFYAGYLAVMATIADADRLFPEIVAMAPLRYEEIKLSTATRIQTLKAKYNLTNEIIYFYNPDISRYHVRANGLLPARYVFKIPTFAPTQISDASTTGAAQADAISIEAVE